MFDLFIDLFIYFCEGNCSEEFGKEKNYQCISFVSSVKRFNKLFNSRY